MYLKLREYVRDHDSLVFGVILVFLVTLIAYYRVQIQIEIGPIWDTFDFLSNAMYFAGQGFGYTDLTRPPFFPFLTSLIFRLGVVSESVIFYLDASFLVFGAVGLYLFLRMKFDAMESFLGSLLFSTFPVVVLFTGVGLTDIPSVSLSIWALYATVLAVKKNPLFFYISFPLAMLAFLTRYPAGFIIFPIFFYLVINRHEVSLKNMIGGILLSLLPGLIVLLFFYNQFGNPLGPFSSFYGSTQKAGSTTYVYYHPDPLYFLKHILSYIGVGGMIIILGLVISAFVGLVTRFNDIKLKFKQYSVPEMALHTKIKVLMLFLLFSLFIITFARTHYFISEIIFLVFCFVLFYTLRNSNIKDLDIHLFFVSWFMAFLIFHSVYTVKDDRYFITMTPALTYFLILGFSQIKKFWALESKYKNMIYNIFAVILVFMMLVAAAVYIPGIYDHESKNVVDLNDIKMASQWLEINDPQYFDKNISSDQWPYFSWYLKTNVKQVQLFNSNKDYENNLNRDNATYFLTDTEGLNLTNYQLIKQFGYVTIYKRQ
ncbi:glycosyltransferase family 39 protein [uncultured Methanobacterium sp.]|uniref:glycosyltransferase family 39 protein n=1 Tax=uncultured Methanobacterium sp. TaxID=176306 RepID=UPI002AA7587D|nr:glycosyltransferase family 39 protein [uncultured Methanobacterium sp.]